MINPSEWDISEKVLGGAGVTGMALIALQKAITFFRGEQAVQNNASATAAQFKALQESITATNKELAEVRASFHIMDRKVHIQQRVITKLEMVVLRMLALIEDNSISIPAPLQADIDILTKDLRGADQRTRASDKDSQHDTL